MENLALSTSDFTHFYHTLGANLGLLLYGDVSVMCIKVDYCDMSHDVRKPVFGFPTRSDTNRAAQLLNEARDLKFWIYKVEGLYYQCSENKGADQLCGYRTTDLRLCFRICKNPVFSRRGSIFFLITIVTISLVTRADIARDSKPIIGPHVNPYRPSRKPISARWNKMAERTSKQMSKWFLYKSFTQTRRKKKTTTGDWTKWRPAH